MNYKNHRIDNWEVQTLLFDTVPETPWFISIMWIIINVAMNHLNLLKLFSMSIGNNDNTMGGQTHQCN